jgi:hypothetical protein
MIPRRQFRLRSLFISTALAVTVVVALLESTRRISAVEGEAPSIGDCARLRLMIETDAGGDPDDEQSLVRFLLYTNEWDVEGIIANRPGAVDDENLNRERTGLGIVRQAIEAYGQCQPTLVEHDRRFPTAEYLLQRTVAGYEDAEDGVQTTSSASTPTSSLRPGSSGSIRFTRRWGNAGITASQPSRQMRAALTLSGMF